MKNTTTKRLPAAVFMLLCLLRPGATAAAPLEVFENFFDVMPGIDLEDLGHSKRSLQEFQGQVVLINFWASWCGPCVIEMPSLERLQQAMSGKPFAILGVNVGESHGKVWNFAAKFKLTFPMLLDSEGQTAADWQVVVYPTTFLVDTTGDIRYVAYGPRGWDSPDMIQAIEQLFEAPRADTPRETGMASSAAEPATHHAH